MPTLAQISLTKLKQPSGTSRFAAFFGASNLPSDSDEYRLIERCTESLLVHGYGVLHDGYAGGTMSAVSDTAHKYVTKNSLPPERNIGVPQRQHDGLWARVEHATFTTVAEDIFERLSAICAADIAIVGPLGGDGTELEQTAIFHENIIRTQINTHGGNIPYIPLVFLQTDHGTDWKKLVQTKLKLLNVQRKSVSG
jgi:predicted Rossmann-fold nucleotide-binding protein